MMHEEVPYTAFLLEYYGSGQAQFYAGEGNGELGGGKAWSHNAMKGKQFPTAKLAEEYRRREKLFESEVVGHIFNCGISDA